MSVAIVSTSVNPRPDAYERWAREGDLIVAGDKNTPQELVEYVGELGGCYLGPSTQERWSWSTYVGWHCIQRRNAAVMQAYADGYDVIITVDDDNVPIDTRAVGQEVTHLLSVPFNGPLLEGRDGWYDIGRCSIPRVRQRGTPYDVDTRVTSIAGAVDVAVVQLPVLGVPDCDAIERIYRDPTVESYMPNVAISPGTWAAFNSQATAWRGEWAPFIACLPHVGRYDDIWASFIFERVARERHVALLVGGPPVHQDRNPHDYFKDLINELYGMQQTHNFIEAIDTCDVWGLELPDAYVQVALAARNVLPVRTTTFMLAWANEWSHLQKARTQ